jgi:hypothetical protein
MCGRRKPADAGTVAAQRAFTKMGAQVWSTAHADVLHWIPIVGTNRRGSPVVIGGYGMRAYPPSLKLFALAQIIGAAQERQPARECEQCHDLFLRPERRPGAKGKYVRKDVRYCSQSCAQKAWYERGKKGSR